MSIRFEVGDRVRLIEVRQMSKGPRLNHGDEGTVIRVAQHGATVTVKFDNGLETGWWYPSRFELAGPAMSPVERKIKQLWERSNYYKRRAA